MKIRRYVSVCVCELQIITNNRTDEEGSLLLTERVGLKAALRHSHFSMQVGVFFFIFYYFFAQVVAVQSVPLGD